ncbi:acyltransferase family protein [Massilia niabensis]|uniref:Acyltransferase family protein n=1 Tax=Massilia niabensis TaxID=544910 RepID=A0ABW0L3A4_9BURK
MTPLSNPSSLRQRRDDIQGIRVIGALLVFTFHVFFSGVSGGVDVFFVISGYFLASNALKRGEVDKPAPILRFYRDFLLRMAPQAVIALIGIVLLLFFFMSPMVWSTNLRDIGASALYLENWRLISKGQNYLARSEVPTLVQHFWAVSLIGQTYFAWPFVLRMGQLATRGLGGNPRNVLTLLLCILSFASFAWSLYSTSTSPSRSYFDFFSRFWEFGCGALLGLHGSASGTATPSRAAALSWLGLALLLGCGFLIGSTLAFPGYASLWPVTAALLLIRYGRPDNRLNASWLLSRPWLADFGMISFGVYLWHWPLYVVYSTVNHVAEVPLVAGLMLLALSIVCALLSKKAVDWCFSTRRVSSSTTLVPLGFLSLLLMISSSSEFARREVLGKGRSWDSGNIESAGFIAPGPFSVREDNASVYKSGCHQNATSAKLKSCGFGRPGAKKTIVVVGGSHAAQWLPALVLHAEKEDWQIISMTKSGCVFADPADTALFATRHVSCAKWNTTAIDAIITLKPDLVLSLATRHHDGKTGRVEYVPDGYLSRFKQLDASGIRILALRDNPWMPRDVPVCVYSPIVEDKNICGQQRNQVLNDTSFAESRKKIPLYVHVADMSAQFCDKSQCWAIKDGVVIYRDSHHITATYAEHISPVLRDAVRSSWIERAQL